MDTHTPFFKAYTKMCKVTKSQFGEAHIVGWKSMIASSNAGQ